MFKNVTAKMDFPQNEKKILDRWYKSGVVDKYLRKNKNSKKKFFFLDGPITANNPMGVHHAWGRTYKDLWQRFYNMLGYEERFQNGFDCQGLWVEVEVEKELGFKTKKDIEKYGVEKFVEKCKKRVEKYAAIQTEQSKRLGYFMDWDNSYFTMSDENNYMIWYFLKVCYQKGWLYKSHDSSPWCPRCQTAISQHEMLTEDYKELTHKSIYFVLPLKETEGESLLVWTTTPWTIPANIAVAVDGKIDYSLLESGSGEKYWLAKDAVKRVFQNRKYKEIKTVKGKKLVGLKYKGPFDNIPGVKKVADENKDTFHTVVATDQLIMPITTTEGTGIVHTAVSAGSEDFKLGKKYGLPMIPVIADDASYLDNLGFLSGKNAKDNPELVLDYMVEESKNKGVNWVFNIHDYTHRYPRCWRCKTELVWKVTDEWYIAMDKKEKNGKTLREQMVNTAKMIKWYPSFGLDRELDWLKNMHDWLISKKNRYWGLCLPIWECEKCGFYEVIGSKNELREKASKGYRQFKGKSPHKPQIDKIKIKCRKCNNLMSRVEPVGNPWLDAGIVSFSTLVDPETKKLSYTDDKKYWKKWFPADFITESFPGQFKNWFYSLIAMSTVLEQTASFKTVLGFGTLLSEDGRPMHKSWGNAIEFNEGADNIGVDVMRWMYVSQNPSDNLLFGYKKADEVRRKFLIPLWNIYKFFVTYANIDKWKPRNNQESTTDNILDKWILSKLHLLIDKVTRDLKKYDARDASMSIQDFITDLSIWFVRRSRDRVGIGASAKEDKNYFYQTLYGALVTLTKLLAPFTPYLPEEIYQNLTNNESVHLESWPVSDKKKVNKDLEKEMKDAREIVVLAHAVRKNEMIKVRQPLSAMEYSRSKKLDKKIEQLIMDELNLKNLRFKKSAKLGAKFSKSDLTITKELKKEGEARDIIRKIQQKRKKLGCQLTDKVNVTLIDFPSEYYEYIKKHTLSEKLVKGNEFVVEKL